MCTTTYESNHEELVAKWILSGSKLTLKEWSRQQEISAEQQEEVISSDGE